MSAAASAKEIKASGPSTKTQLKRATSDLIHRESKDRTLQKAVEGKKEVAPKRKHVRNMVLRSWRENGLAGFYRDAARLPLDTDAVMCYRSLIVFHKLLHEGPPNALLDAHGNLGWLDGLHQMWSMRPSGGGYGGLIKAYTAMLKAKVLLHATHQQLPGSLSPSEFEASVERSGQRLALRFLKDATQRLIALQEAVQTMQETIYSLEQALLTEVKVSALIPLVQESWNDYGLTVSLLQRAVAQTSEDDQEVGFLLQHFYEQYPRIRRFYEETSTVQYVTSTISVPSLPRQPPDFRRQAPAVAKPVSPRPVTAPPPKPPTPPPQSFAQPTNMLDFFSQPPPAMAFPQQHAPIAFPPPQPVQMSFQSLPPPQWVGFDSSASLMSSSLFPQPPLFPTGSSVLLSHSAAPLPPSGFMALSPSGLPFSSPASTPQPDPMPALIVPQVIAAPVASVAVDTAPQKAQLSYDDLKKRFVQLQELFKKERTRNLELEALLKQANEETALWKQRHEELRTQHQQLRTQHEELLESFGEMQTRVVSLERQGETEQRRNALRELDASKASLDRALLSLLGSAATLSDRPQDILGSVADIAASLDRLGAAKTPEERMVALRDISQATEALLGQIRAVAAKVEDPVQRQQLVEMAENVARALSALLETAQFSPNDAAALQDSAGRVRAGLAELAEIANSLVSLQQARADGADEFADEATRELLQAAAVIDQAARSLAATRAMQKPKLSVQDVAISDAIIDAASAIATATKRLVTQATTVQKENIATGRARGETSSSWYLKNAKWAQGLISAAKSVAEGTSMLVHSANETAFGRVQEEALIASSMSVSASTTQLVAAARVRSDPNSPQQQSLEVAAKGVTQSTSNLVAAAKSVRIPLEEQQETFNFNESTVQRMRAQQEAQMKVLELQKHLEQAQTRLFRLNQSQYAAAGAGADGAPSRS
ncbi:MAG: hypothetical protein Q8P67_04070 [archaeon]|nr:hypothetical protein [archaeon]